MYGRIINLTGPLSFLFEFPSKILSITVQGGILTQTITSKQDQS